MEIEESGKKIYVVRMVDWLTGDLKSFS
jgi:hypothetical protein